MSVLVLFGYLLLGSPPVEDSVVIERDCGPYCVGIVLGLLGREIPDMDHLRRTTRADGRGLTTLKDLALTLEAHGLRVRVASPGERMPQSLLIVPQKRHPSHGDLHHFTVVDGRAGGEPILYTPPLWVTRTRWNSVRETAGARILIVERPMRMRSAQIAAALALAVAGAVGWLYSRKRRRDVQGS